MKILLVSHPDDELLWFNPVEYDKIIIVFTDRDDIQGFGEKRREAMSELPYKVETWGLRESGYHYDKTRAMQYQMSYLEVCERLKDLQADEVTTHNANGEYGHADHILLHNACMDTLDCKVNGKDPKVYREAKKVYEQYEVWTWH